MNSAWAQLAEFQFNVCIYAEIFKLKKYKNVQINEKLAKPLTCIVWGNSTASN